MSIEETIKWLSTNNLSVSATKVSAAVFTRHRLPSIIGQVRIGNHVLQIKDNIKILGINLDTKMNFKRHISEISAKCEKGLNILRKITNTKWGAYPETCLMLYRSIIRSRIDYGCFIYGAVSQSEQKKLDRIQFSAVRTCLGAFRSTPTNVLINEAGEPPLTIRRQALSKRFLVKKLNEGCDEIPKQLENLARLHVTSSFWKNRPAPPLITSFYEIKPNEEFILTNKKIPYYNFPEAYATVNPYIDLTINLTNLISISKICKNKDFEDNIAIRYPEHLHIYTDGSKMENSAGCAIYVPNHKYSKKLKLPNFTSIFTAEIIAIHTAVKYAWEKKIPKCIIFSDSKASILALQKPNRRSSQLIYEIINTMKTINNSENSMTLIWIKAHADIIGNETADSLAREACQNGEEYTRLPALELNYLVKEQILKTWQREFSKSLNYKGTTYALTNMRITQKTWFKKVKEDRKFISTISRLRFGHTRSTRISRLRFGHKIPCASVAKNKKR
ncbi:uncharacterized protein LOC113375686 [Ctenocephalides felis]|uniref:uncharacterized protein LOC113375686 n=1 Tax=Ctenocephalides felis TaxID=7515 RepID=UPI000E6E279B|nr:uncharacterized protein LOC113375686 [Ctenocephalides felis]